MTTPGTVTTPPAAPDHHASGLFGEVRSWVVFLRRFAYMAGPYWQSGKTWQDKGRIHGSLAALVLLTVLQVFMPIWLNQWNADFFNALEDKSWSNFLREVGVLGAILVSNMAITSAHLWFKRRIQVDWRAWLTDQVLRDWMSDGHQQQVIYLPGKHDNPDGRIAEDIRNVTEVAIELAHTLFYSSLLLIGFTQILWSLSGTLEAHIGSISFAIPGHLVFIALLYSIVFSSLALRLSRPLVLAAKDRQEREANFRFELGRARENAETIALLRGEPNERRRFARLFSEVIAIWEVQSRALTKILMFIAGYSVLSTAFPLLVAAPRYLTGTLTLGTLMQTVQAFQQMIQALSWPVDNSTKAAEWRGFGERVLGLSDALASLHQLPADERSRIVVVETDRPVLALRHVCISMPDGRTVLANSDVEIHPGERVLISSDAEAAAKLFRVLGGLWPWGCGRVERPRGATIFLLPQRPYVPKGNLRAIVSYPTPSHGIEDDMLAAALRRVGLAPLAQRLNDSASWDQILTRGELRRLGFARILLHKPDWICLQEASDVLDPSEEDALMQLLRQVLPEAAILSIGSRPGAPEYYHRHLRLGHTKISQILAAGEEEVLQCGCVPEGVPEGVPEVPSAVPGDNR